MNETLKEGIIKEAGIAACKILVTAFKMCELKTHIEQMFIDDNTGEEFILKFYSKDGFDRFLKQNESEPCLHRNDYVEYIGGSNSKYLTKGKKYRLTGSLWGNRIAVEADNRKRMNTLQKYFKL